MTRVRPDRPRSLTSVSSHDGMERTDRPPTPPHSWLGRLFSKLKRFQTTIVAAASVGAVLSGLVGYWTAYKAVAPIAAPSMPASISAAGPLSIVVLPFANQTGDPQKAYIADALTTSITADLSRIRDAFVIGSTTAFAYKGKTVTLEQLGRDLGVRFVLQGSVLSSGEQVRIGAELADTGSGAQLWSETFDGELTNLFGLQDRVTARIGNSIGREMVIAAARRSETHKSNPQAVDLMLQARALNLKPQSLANHQLIERLYREILALEPGNANAMVGLATSLVVQVGNFGSGMSSAEREQRFVLARDLALKAKDIDPDHPGVYVAIAAYAANHNDFVGYQSALQTRLALEPKNPGAYANLALSYVRGGQPRKAVELLQQAIALDPRHPPDGIFVTMGGAYLTMSDYESAIGWYQKALDTNPGFASVYAFLAIAYTLKGEDSGAHKAMEDLHRIDPNYHLGLAIRPRPSDSSAYRDFLEQKALPAARKAGLRE